ncbi:hypothetical protein BGW41_003387 [Actinomortierella wolfii]|nr:hypothetical protein BGW41_003387 [Actinomortierella wolfii]
MSTMDWLVSKTTTIINSYASTLDNVIEAGTKLESTLSPAATRIIRTIFGNDVLSAGFFLMIIGGMYTFLKDSIIYYYNEILGWFYVSVEVQEGDECYDWLNDWVAGRPLTRSVSHLTVKAVWDSDDNDDYIYNYDNHREERPKLVFLPGKGSHVFYYKGRKITISRERPDSASGGNPETERLLASIQKKQSLTISTFGRDIALLKSIVQEAMEDSYKKNAGKTAIFTCQQYDNYWSNTGSRSPRAFHTVILAKGVKEALLEDIMTFRKSADWYHERGIPYRRGYLLHGPPGTGKTSFIVALAGHLGLSVCILNLSSKGLNDQQLDQLMNHAPRNALILIEDVDAALLGKQPGEAQSGSNTVTLSGLLNALDGVTAHEGSILFMTTNHIRKLAPALIRPGRCDRKLLFDYADSDQVREMFLKFFLTLPSDYVKKSSKKKKVKKEKKAKGFILNSLKDESESEDEVVNVSEEERTRRQEYDAMIRQQADKMAELITKKDAITPAQLQGFFMLYRDNPEVIVDKVPEFKQELIAERKELAEKKQQRHERRKKREEKLKAKKEKERAEKLANGEEIDSSEENGDDDDESDSFSDSDYYEEVKSLGVANGHSNGKSHDGDDGSSSSGDESSKTEINGH